MLHFTRHRYCHASGKRIKYGSYYKTAGRKAEYFKTTDASRLLDRLKANEIRIAETVALEHMPREVVTFLRQAGVLTVQQYEKFFRDLI